MLALTERLDAVCFVKLISHANDTSKMSRRYSVVDQEPWENFQTSASTKTTTMTTAAKLYGKDLSEYDDVDVDELLAQLTPEEINILAKEVDPDVRIIVRDKFRWEFSLAFNRYSSYSYRTASCHPRNAVATNVTRARQAR